MNYWGVHAFTFTNANGEKHVVKYKALPVGGEVGLSDDEAKAKAPDFYAPELKDRLAKGPAEFTLTAILGEAGDPADNPTTLWPEDQRKAVTLGTISISALEDNATCDAGVFDPTNVVDGIEGPAERQDLPDALASLRRVVLTARKVIVTDITAADQPLPGPSFTAGSQLYAKLKPWRSDF